MIGRAEAGNPVGTLLFVPLAQLLMSTLGWQETFRVLGLVFLLLLGPGNVFFVRRAPAETPVGGPTGTIPRERWPRQIGLQLIQRRWP